MSQLQCDERHIAAFVIPSHLFGKWKRTQHFPYTSGTTEMNFKDASGKTNHDKGKYLTVWKKQADGSWKVLYDMFNSDLPTTP